MKNFKYTLISAAYWIVAVLVIGGCLYLILPVSNGVEHANSYTKSSYADDEYEVNHPDGKYSAEVNYYNPNTGTSSTYTLDVEVENNELTVIYWPNGGWLDDSHFTPQELDSYGSCSFTSDAGYDYEVQITDPAYSDSSKDDYESDISEYLKY